MDVMYHVPCTWAWAWAYHGGAQDEVLVRGGEVARRPQPGAQHQPGVDDAVAVAQLQGRRVMLKAKFESGSSHFSFKR